LLRVPKWGQLVHAHRMPTIGWAKRGTRGAIPATVSLITRPPQRHNHPAAQHRSTRDREDYGEMFLPGVVATDWTRHMVRTSGTGETAGTAERR
jgi:hypothetical protein